MPKVPDVTQQDGVIHKGATFYWEVTLYDDAEHTVLTPLDGYTPVAELTTSNGTTVIPFSCAYLDATDSKPQRIAMVGAKADTETLTLFRSYPYKLSLVADTGESYLKLNGYLMVDL